MAKDLRLAFNALESTGVLTGKWGTSHRRYTTTSRPKAEPGGTSPASSRRSGTSLCESLALMVRALSSRT